jgi:hypothetical protein
MTIRPITLREAYAFVDAHHRHHSSPQGGNFALSVRDGERLCGVAIAGRPVARRLQDGLTLEVTRVATDGSRNACSMLYGACRRVAFAMGYRRLITYTLLSEPGTSLRAAGWMEMGHVRADRWSRRDRRRADRLVVPKRRWELAAA